MKLLFATALSALGLAIAALCLRYDVMALSESQLRDPFFQMSAATVAVSLLLVLEAMVVMTRPRVPAVAEPAPVVSAAADLKLQNEKAALETALRDVEQRLAAEKAKKLQPATAADAEAQVVQFLSLLQERGRFVDFLMQDVQTFGDEQVGRAARIVHQGCRAVLQELCTLTPVTGDAEGSTVSIGAGQSSEFRLIGSVSGAPPYQGRVLHRGWRTTKVNLPARIEKSGATAGPAQGYVVVPAEVELSPR